MKNTIKLSQIPHDKTVTVKELKSNGSIRRRLLDLGFIPGNNITPLFSDLTNSITAYSVNGAVIALRCNDADSILVECDEELKNG